MKYTFRRLTLSEEIKNIVGDMPFRVTDDGTELVIDFGGKSLTNATEAALSKYMRENPVLRGKQAIKAGDSYGQ